MRKRWLSEERRFTTGCALAGVAGLGLMTAPLTWRLPFIGDTAAFSLLCVFTALMALGTTLAIFSLKRP